MRDRRAAAWKMLTPVERDALIVLTAMCKVGSSGTMICRFPHTNTTQLGGLGEVCHDGLEWHFCLLLCTMAAAPPCWLPLAHEPAVFLAATMLEQMAARETGLGTVESYMHKGETYPCHPQCVCHLAVWAVCLNRLFLLVVF